MVSELFPLSLEGVETSRKGKRLVGPVDLRIEKGEVTAIIGPNGAGKTSLLRLVHGAARLTAGQISWACPTDSARAAQAFVFQRPIMLRRSVEENLIYPLRLRKIGRADARAQAREWAVKLGLKDALRLPAPQLSGGEQQKLAIARALITKPQLVFLDEPTASLDGRATAEIEALLQAARQAGTALILATHDMGQARRLADQVVFLRGGRVHEHGPAASFFANPQTTEATAFLAGEIVT